jgi:hypothetical protein
MSKSVYEGIVAVVTVEQEPAPAPGWLGIQRDWVTG